MFGFYDSLVRGMNHLQSPKRTTIIDLQIAYALLQWYFSWQMCLKISKTHEFSFIAAISPELPY